MTTAHQVSESEWLTAVGDALDWNGWWWDHSRPARRKDGQWVTATQGSGSRGFPDIVAVRDDRTLFMELKADKGRVSPEQTDWIGRLNAAGQEAHIIRMPGDWEIFTALTAREPEQMTLTSNRKAGCTHPEPVKPRRRVPAAVSVAKALDSFDTRLADVFKTTATAQVLMAQIQDDERETMKQTTDARDQVDALADERIARGDASTRAEARAAVWHDHPELVAKSRQETVAVADQSAQTISERVREVIEEAATKASWLPLMESWGHDMSRHEIIAKVRVELWRTPEGQALRDFDRAAGSKPYTRNTVAEVRKSNDAARFAKALDVLEHGFTG